MNTSSTIEEREQWRARILRALAELRGDDERNAKRTDDRDDDRGESSTSP